MGIEGREHTVDRRVLDVTLLVWVADVALDEAEDVAERERHLPELIEPTQPLEVEDVLGAADRHPDPCRRLGVVDHDLGNGLLNIIERRQKHLIGLDPRRVDVVLLDQDHHPAQGLMSTEIVARTRDWHRRVVEGRPGLVERGLRDRLLTRGRRVSINEERHKAGRQNRRHAGQ